MSIRLQFIREADILSGTIAWFSAGHFSHVDIIMPDSGLLLGARFAKDGAAAPGVQYRPPGYLKSISRRVVIEVPASLDEEDLFYYFAFSQVGKPYDTQAIFAFVFNRDWRQPDSWICSEYGAACMEYAEIVPSLYLAANKVTPVALALVSSAIGGKVVSDTDGW